MSNELHETDMPPTPVADNAANSAIEPAPVSEGLAEALALLGQHQQGFREHRRPAFYCTGCDWTAAVVANGCDSNGVTIEDQHRAHVAAVIAHGWLPGVIRAAEARALREAADGMEAAVSRGDMIWAVPECHKTNCRCGANTGSPDLVVIGVANAFRDALHDRADRIDQP